MSKPTQARLRELLHYDEDAGVFTWRIGRRKCVAGAVAGTTTKFGPLIGLDGRQYLAHHLVWLYMRGEWPEGMVSHVNGDNCDNRWENLRLTKRARVSALTQEVLKSELAYNEQTGAFVWCRIGSPGFGRTVQTLNESGYVVMHVLGRLYRAHRLAWLYVHGVMPTQEIDHINRDRADNRIANLRLATSSQNKQNTPLRCDNTSGFRGVTKKRRKWEARIDVDGKAIRLGVFPTPEEASAARQAAAAALHTHRPMSP
jgi:hypothetical protein